MCIELLLVGAGGHAKVVIDAIKASDPKVNIGLADDHADIIGQQPFGEITVTSVTLGVINYDNIHISIGHNGIRATQFLHMIKMGKQLITIVHPLTCIAMGAEIGDGCFIAANAIVSSAAIIGRGCIINHAAIIDHDCNVDEFSHIAPNATLGGGVVVGKNCLIGTSAVVLPNISIGDNVIVGAGAVVTKDIKANYSVVGVPARHINK